MLTRTTTIHELLADYPFLAAFLAERDRAFSRLRDPSSAQRWARMVTLGELAVRINVPWLDLLREIQAEVRRVTAVAPAIAGATAGALDDDLRDDVSALMRELEGGAPLGATAARLDELTPGLDADGVAALAEARGRAPDRPGTAWTVGRPAQLPDPHATLHPGHPISALRRECTRLSGLADLVDEVAAGVGEPPDAQRLDEARASLLTLVERLVELERQGRRLRLAWYPLLSGRIGPSVAALVTARMAEALDALWRLRAAAVADEAATVVGLARAAVAQVRRVVTAEQELLAPAAFRALDDDDWEAVAEREPDIGWALDPGRAP